MYAPYVREPKLYRAWTFWRGWFWCLVFSGCGLVVGLLCYAANFFEPALNPHFLTFINNVGPLSFMLAIQQGFMALIYFRSRNNALGGYTVSDDAIQWHHPRQPDVWFPLTEIVGTEKTRTGIWLISRLGPKIFVSKSAEDFDGLMERVNRARGLSPTDYSKPISATGSQPA